MDTTMTLRHHRRFIPQGCLLTLRATGILSAFSQNICRGVMDISEGGFAAVVSRRPYFEEVFKAHLTMGPYQEGFDVLVEVRRVELCLNTDGCFVVGFKFLNPSPVLRVCLQSLLHESLKKGPIVFRRPTVSVALAQGVA